MTDRAADAGRPVLETSSAVKVNDVIARRGATVRSVTAASVETALRVAMGIVRSALVTATTGPRGRQIVVTPLGLRGAMGLAERTARVVMATDRSGRIVRPVMVTVRTVVGLRIVRPVMVTVRTVVGLRIVRPVMVT
ncbi:hypothetical protein, partial [Curtobacterium sp. VKM Ac-1376]|uniref:hypothetical protein n=1 Tax=Curtobacterium sp. VKM Ac-1376 TaxID=123312 RepID=UPI00188A288E